jgi:hypothetical protein
MTPLQRAVHAAAAAVGVEIAGRPIADVIRDLVPTLSDDQWAPLAALLALLEPRHAEFFVWTGRNAWRIVSARTAEEAACRAVEEIEGDACDFQVGSGLASRRVRVKVGGALRSYCVTGELMPSYEAEEVLG